MRKYSVGFNIMKGFEKRLRVINPNKYPNVKRVFHVMKADGSGQATAF